MGNSASSNLPALQTAAGCETSKMMGTWFVHGVKPTFLEKSNSNAVEKYTWVGDDTSKDHDIDIDFKYNKKEDPTSSPLSSLGQKGWVDVEANIAQGGSKEKGGNWKVSPFWPVKMPYLILEVDETSYDYCIIGYPNRSYAWIMGRKPIMDDKIYNELTNKLKEKHQYDLNGLRRVPQIWSAEEREKRGLTKEEIPDNMLTK